MHQHQIESVQKSVEAIKASGVDLLEIVDNVSVIIPVGDIIVRHNGGIKTFQFGKRYVVGKDLTRQQADTMIRTGGAANIRTPSNMVCMSFEAFNTLMMGA